MEIPTANSEAIEQERHLSIDAFSVRYAECPLNGKRGRAKGSHEKK
jgi:hypothetical protein